MRMAPGAISMDFLSKSCQLPLLLEHFLYQPAEFETKEDKKNLLESQYQQAPEACYITTTSPGAPPLSLLLPPSVWEPLAFTWVQSPVYCLYDSQTGSLKSTFAYRLTYRLTPQSPLQFCISLY